MVKKYLSISGHRHCLIKKPRKKNPIKRTQLLNKKLDQYRLIKAEITKTMALKNLFHHMQLPQLL